MRGGGNLIDAQSRYINNVPAIAEMQKGMQNTTFKETILEGQNRNPHNSIIIELNPKGIRFSKSLGNKYFFLILYPNKKKKVAKNGK